MNCSSVITTVLHWQGELMDTHWAGRQYSARVHRIRKGVLKQNLTSAAAYRSAQDKQAWIQQRTHPVLKGQVSEIAHYDQRSSLGYKTGVKWLLN